MTIQTKFSLGQVVRDTAKNGRTFTVGEIRVRVWTKERAALPDAVMKLTEYRSVEPPAKPDRYFPNRVINGPWIAERYLEAATLRQIATLAAKDGTR